MHLTIFVKKYHKLSCRIYISTISITKTQYTNPVYLEHTFIYFVSPVTPYPITSCHL